MLHIIIRKARSARYRLHEFSQKLQTKAASLSRARSFHRWVRRLKKKGPEVLVGANFVASGGTRQHMHSIAKYSSLRVALVPDEEVLSKLVPYYFADEFNAEFLKLKFPQVKAVHSHVFPWFIKWCHHQRLVNNVRWIHTHHNWYYPEFGKDGLEPWQADFNQYFLFALNNADVCLSVSRWQQKFLLDSFGMMTHYLPNGVDVASCDRARPERFLHRTAAKKFTLYLGRNDPVKNPVDFVRLACLLPNRSFVMAGEGLSKEVLTQEWNVDVPNNLTVLGALSHQEAQDAIAACEVLVMTSKREGLPTLALEGLVQRKPVIVPDESGCLEAVGHGERGFVYPQGNIDQLAECTLKAHRDIRNVEAIRHSVVGEYSWPVVMRKLDEIYRGAACP